MSNKDSYDRQLKGVVNALARSIVEATDDEIIEDAKATRANLEANAAELRQRFLETAKRFQKRKFVQAQQAYAEEVQSLQRRTFQLPTSPEDRLALLQLVVAQQTQQGNRLTAKFRDFENMSPSDIISLLEELAALGLLPEGGHSEEP